MNSLEPAWHAAPHFLLDTAIAMDRSDLGHVAWIETVRDRESRAIWVRPT